MHMHMYTRVHASVDMHVHMHAAVRVQRVRDLRWCDQVPRIYVKFSDFLRVEQRRSRSRALLTPMGSMSVGATASSAGRQSPPADRASDGADIVVGVRRDNHDVDVGVAASSSSMHMT